MLYENRLLMLWTKTQQQQTDQHLDVLLKQNQPILHFWTEQND